MAGRSESSAATTEPDRLKAELTKCMVAYGKKFEAITAALGHATEAQDKLAFGEVDAAMEEIGKAVSILVDA